MTGQMAQVDKRVLLVREAWGSNPGPIKSPTCYKRLNTAATMKNGPKHKAAEMGTVTRDAQKGT